MSNNNFYSNSNLQEVSRRGEIAIFWDFDSYYGSVEVTNPSLFASELINVTRLFRPQLHSAHDVLRVYGNFSDTGHISYVEQLQAAGFEVVDTSVWTVDAKNNICMLMLLWLYDSEKLRKNNWNPCMVVVSRDKIFVNLLAKLFARGVCVVSVNDLDEPELSEWREISSFLLTFNIPNHSTVDFNVVSTIDNSIPAPTRAAIPRAGANIDFNTGAMVRNVNTGNNPDVSDYATRHDLNDLMAINEEQQQLQDELAFAIRSQNVQLAVSKLRKIYTKQFRGFRIPTILGTISQESGPDRLLSYSEIAFILGCIQWCYGGQKGDNVDSFTYKMNKNIARWLLKDLQRKHFEASIYAEILPVVVVTVQNILKQVVEFDFCLEILQFLNVENPLGVLSPQLYTWGFSSNPSQALRAKDFALQLGFPDSFFHNPIVPGSQGGNLAGGGGGGMGMQGGSGLGLSGGGGLGLPSGGGLGMLGGSGLGLPSGSGLGMSSGIGGLHIQTPPPPPSLYQYGNTANSSFPASGLGGLDGILGGGGTNSSSGGVGNRDNRINYLDPQSLQGDQQLQQPQDASNPLTRSAPLSFQDKIIRPSVPSTTTITPMIQRRITNIISMFNQGVSGTQLLDVYNREYGEPLGLSGRRLQDVVSAIENVEVIGTGMSGDVYYKLNSLN